MVYLYGNAARKAKESNDSVYIITIFHMQIYDMDIYLQIIHVYAYPVSALRMYIRKKSQ